MELFMDVLKALASDTNVSPLFREAVRPKSGEQTPTHISWRSMLQRCRNPGHKSAEQYQDLDIQDSWMTFAGFLADMGERPEGTSLDRRDSNKGYNKDNCRWATPLEQSRNRGLFKTNRSGIKGVAVKKVAHFVARTSSQYGEQVLYQGPDFLEACCRRKSWEAKIGGVQCTQ